MLLKCPALTRNAATASLDSQSQKFLALHKWLGRKANDQAQLEGIRDREVKIAKVKAAACRLSEAVAALGYPLGGGSRCRRMIQNGSLRK